MKKLIALLLILALAVGMFAGCAGKRSDDEDWEDKSYRDDDEDDDDDRDDEDEDDDDREDEEEEKPSADDQSQLSQLTYNGGKVTITFAHTMGAKLQSSLDYYIQEFNKLYPNITIEHESYGAWADIEGRINTEFIGGKVPNIAYCTADHVASYNLSESVVVLDELIDNTQVQEYEGGETIVGLTEDQKNNFINGFYELGRVFGDRKMYSLPLSKSAEVLYYNKTFFEENNISVPTTWEEMEAVCQQLKELDPDCIPLGYDSEENLFINLCEQYGYPYTTSLGMGADHFLFNNEQCKDLVKQLRQWYQAGYITTESICGTYTSDLFIKTQAYMSIGSSGGATYNIPENKLFEVGIAPIPQADLANPKVLCEGPSLCILRDGNTSDQQLAASWLFVKFLTTDEAFQTEFSNVSGYMPVLKSVLDNENYQRWLSQANGFEGITALAVKAALEQSYAYFTSAAFNGSAIARGEVGRLLSKAMYEEDPDIDQLFEDAYDECVYLAG